MDDLLLNLYLKLPLPLQLAVLVICPLIVAAKAYCATTPTPPPNTTAGRIYRFIEIAALLVGKAKQEGVPVPSVTTLESAFLAEKDASEKEGRAFDIGNVVRAMTAVVPVLLICFTLSGCGLPLTGDPAKDLPAAAAALTSADSTAHKSVAALAKFTAADIQGALADAQANSDAPAVSCYQAILPVVQAQENQQAPVVGVVSTFQRSRDVVKLVKGQGAIAQACAALKQDVTGDVLGIGTLFGLP